MTFWPGFEVWWNILAQNWLIRPQNLPLPKPLNPMLALPGLQYTLSDPSYVLVETFYVKPNSQYPAE